MFWICDIAGDSSIDVTHGQVQSGLVAVVSTALSVDRQKKHVVVDGTFIVPYDHVILCTGVQYQLPKPTGLDVGSGATNSDIECPERPQPRLLGPAPKNMFVVNDAYEAAIVLYWLENNLLMANGTWLCSVIGNFIRHNEHFMSLTVSTHTSNYHQLWLAEQWPVCDD